MIPSPKEPTRIKIERPTFLGVDPKLDDEFKEFLTFMEISFVVKDSEDVEWPLVEYEGISQDIISMLDSRFGMSKEEIISEYPQLFSS